MSKKGETCWGEMNKISGKIIDAIPSLDTDAAHQIGDALKQLRKLSGLTQSEMAKRLNVGQAAVSKIEGRGEIQVSTIQKFVEALGAKLHIDASFPDDSNLALHVREAFDVESDNENQLILPIFGDDLFRPQRDVVLSIKPEYSDKIIEGLKKVELRRRFPSSVPKGTIAYIYSTSPVRAMVGMVEISGVLKLPVSKIWEQYSNTAYIGKADFDRYFEGVEDGYALEFENVREFSSPLSLAVLRTRFGFEPPQSFLYAKHDLRKALKDEYTIVSH